MKQNNSLFSPKVLFPSFFIALKELNPWSLLRKNPVMFITEIGAIISTTEAIILSNSFYMNIAFWLWITVFLGNLSGAIASLRNKKTAEDLKTKRKAMVANKLVEGKIESIPSFQLKKDDIVIVKQHEFIPADGEIIEGVAAIDESLITGETEAVIRAAGTDKTSVFGGSKVLSDEIKVKVAADPGKGFFDKIINLIESASRQKTKNEIALTILLSGLSFIFLIVTMVMRRLGWYCEVEFSFSIMIAFIVCLIPTTIAALLNAIYVAGIDRLLKKNVLAMDGQSIEKAGDINLVMLDKTGTITEGEREAIEFLCAEGVSQEELFEGAFKTSVYDDTSEGRSIRKMVSKGFVEPSLDLSKDIIPFSAKTRMSGINIDGIQYRKGAIDAIESFSSSALPEKLRNYAKSISEAGGTPLAFCKDKKILGVFYLKDIIKKGLAEKFSYFRSFGIKTVMVTGDNYLTAKTIAREIQVDDFLAAANPEEKLKYLLARQKEGNIVAMTGDGINDAPALAYADVGVAMNSGSQAAKEAANMIDLDSHPIKLFEIMAIGKQLLITRGVLTTFSIANDVSKFFTIFPAMLMPFFPKFSMFNILHLHSSSSAIMSAIIFNSIIIFFLYPLAFKGVNIVVKDAKKCLKQNILLYGVGGILFPFIGIKFIDMLINYLKILNFL